MATCKLKDEHTIKIALKYFLEDCGVHEEYLDNIDEEFREGQMFNKLDSNDYIGLDFSWADTEEGDVYWNRLCNKWQNFASKIKVVKNTKIATKVFGSRIIAEKDGYLIVTGV